MKLLIPEDVRKIRDLQTKIIEAKKKYKNNPLLEDMSWMLGQLKDMFFMIEETALSEAFLSREEILECKCEIRQMLKQMDNIWEPTSYSHVRRVLMDKLAWSTCAETRMYQNSVRG